MDILYIDFETRSLLDVQKVGAHRYCMDESTEMLLCAYAYCGGVVVTDEMSGLLLRLLADPAVLKIAHNAEFDMAVCKYVLGVDVDESQWFDTAYQAAYFGYPRKLSHLTKVLGVRGKKSQEQLNFFSRSVKTLDGVTFNNPKEHPNEWEEFKEYAAADVESMRDCYVRMAPLPTDELFVMRATLRMNFEGVVWDTDLAERIGQRATAYEENASAEALRLYGVANLRSHVQVKNALIKEGVQLESLNKNERGGVTHPLLDLRDQASGSSFSKIKKARQRICSDGRLRGEFVGYGAHTGRWSSRGVQLQNLARITSEVNANLDEVRDYDHLRQHLRLCVKAPSRFRLTCADLSQIEARIVAWLSGCKWRLDAFAEGVDIYARSAERMFHVQNVDKNSPYRHVGKCAELGLGYGGGHNALLRVAPDLYRERGEVQMREIVTKWRSANPEICRLWRMLENAFVSAIQNVSVALNLPPFPMPFRFDGRNMAIHLPSGRALFYRNVAQSDNGLSYLDYSQGGEHPQREKIWGGTLLENVTQAVARDVIVEVMKRTADFTYVGTVHDELWYYSDTDVLPDVLEAMSRPIKWARGLLIKGNGFTADRYYK